MPRRVVLLLLCLVALARPASAQVTFDCEFDKGVASQASPFAYASNAGDHSCTPSATSNHLLICSLCGSLGFTAPAMTWAGGAMTSIVGPTSTSTGARTCVLFGKIANSTGSQTISATWTGGSMDAELGCAQFSNADQSTGWQNTGSDTGTGTTGSSVVTSANNNMVVAAHADNNGTSTTISAGTTDYLQTGLNGNYAQAHRLSTGASQTITWTWTGSQAWANVKVDVIVFGGGGGTPGCKNGLLLLGAGCDQ
jgi:hypothetical protein